MLDKELDIISPPTVNKSFQAVIIVEETFCKSSLEISESLMYWEINLSKELMYPGIVFSNVETLEVNCGITNKARAVISPITVIKVVKMDNGLLKFLYFIYFFVSKKEKTFVSKKVIGIFNTKAIAKAAKKGLIIWIKILKPFKKYPKFESIKYIAINNVPNNKFFLNFSSISFNLSHPFAFITNIIHILEADYNNILYNKRWINIVDIGVIIWEK